MVRSLPLRAYLALRGAEDTGTPLPEMPPRPRGGVVWARCQTPAQASVASGLRKALQADGDAIHLVITVAKQLDVVAPMLPEPIGKTQIDVFLKHWAPDVCLWVGDQLHPMLITEMSQDARPVIGVDMSSAVLRQSDRNWIPGLSRAVLSLFHKIITIDDQSAAALRKSGVPADRVQTIGALEETATVLPYREADRQELARAMGTRSAWLAASAGLEEVETIAIAHHQASRRAHRLMLIVATRDHADGPEMAQALRDKGFEVALRSDETEPVDTTQVYVMDAPDELGLCYRLAPITYLAGSLSGSPCRDPYEAAALGSAVLHGPAIAPWQNRIDLLAKAGGCMALDSANALGGAVEDLLAADKVATIAHAAWDVTSRGADMTERLAAAIIAVLDKDEDS